MQNAKCRIKERNVVVEVASHHQRTTGAIHGDSQFMTQSVNSCGLRCNSRRQPIHDTKCQFTHHRCNSRRQPIHDTKCQFTQLRCNSRRQPIHENAVFNSCNLVAIHGDSQFILNFPFSNPGAPCALKIIQVLQI